MSLCASCGTDRSVGCEHFESTDFAGQQQEIIKVSEAAAGVKKVEPYVPAQRDYSMPAEKYRGPSVIMSKGPAGPEGRQGERGLPGRDANIGECVAAAKSAMQSELVSMTASLRASIVDELKRAGAIDAEGKAVLIPGRDGVNGQDGADSVVPGPIGATGRSGRDGRDGVDGKTGATGPQGTPGRDGDISECRKFVQKEIADLVTNDLDQMITNALISRGVLDEDGKAVPGPQGPQGIPGVGKPGNILAAVANCEQMVEAKLAEFKKELAQ